MSIRIHPFGIVFFSVFAASAQNIPRPNIQAPKGLAVNSFTGNLFYQRNEMSLRGTGLRIYLSFYYNAATDTLDYGYGHGWSFYYNSFYRESGDTVILQHSDAKKDTFYLQGGAYKSPVGVYDTLTKLGSRFTLRYKDGRKEFFADPSHKKLTGIADANGNSVTVIYNSGLPTSILNSSGRALVLAWQNGHLASAKDSAYPAKKYTYNYDSKNDITSVVNPLNGQTSYDYFQHKLVRLADENSNPVVIEYGSGGRVKGITSCNTEQRFTYNAMLRKTFVTSKSGSGSIVNGYFFDAAGRLSGLSDAANNNMVFTYDDRNNLLEWKDFKGRSTRYEYDAKGNLLKETDPQNNSIIYSYEPVFNRPATVQDKRGKITALSYDAAGNLTLITNPDATTQVFTYDGTGRRLTATDAASHTTGYQYNSDGDLIKIQYPVGAVSYQYNGNCCNVGKITDPNGNTLEMTYDLLNRTTSVKDGVGNKTVYIYDAVGNVTKETDPNGISKQYTYDAVNRLAGVTISAGTWLYEYDGQNNLTKMTDANGHKTLYEYDNKNQLTKETDAIGHSTAYSYDAGGNLVKRTDPTGKSVTYIYDELDRLTEKTYDGNSDKYSYDAAGNLVGAYNNNIAYSFEYDNLNRLLKKNILTWGKSLSYTYDGAGNRSTMTDHDGGLTQYLYDANNRLTSLTNPSNLQTTFAYDAGGRILRQNNANGTFTTYHYDAAGRIDSLINWKNNTETISFFYYTFDQFGNRISMKDKHGLNTYAYDSSYRLTKVIYANSSVEEFALDGNGNRTQQIKNGIPTIYTFNGADQIQTAGNSAFVFDANGNTIQQNDSLHRIYMYDGENRLLEVQLSPTKRVSYKYDPFGEKIEKRDTSLIITKMLYDGDNLLGELEAVNSTTKLYTTTFGLDSWLSYRSNGSEYFFHKDGLNSIVQLTDLNASAICHYEYDVYGSVTNKDEGTLNNIRYTGRIENLYPNVYDYKGRVYNSSLGRFLNKDRVDGLISKPASLNKFIYVEDSPTNYIDPLGTSKSSMVFKVVATTARFGGKIINRYVGPALKVFANQEFHTDRNFVNDSPTNNPDADNKVPGWEKEDIGKNRFHQKDFWNEATWDREKYVKVYDDGSSSEAIWDKTEKRWLKCGEEGGPSYNYFQPTNKDFKIWNWSSGDWRSASGHLAFDIIPHMVNDKYKCPPEPPSTPNESPSGPTAPSFPVNIPIIPIVRGGDPNELIGPSGYDTAKKWVSVKATLPYKILFENDSAIATAPAQTVRVYMPIDPKINTASLRIGDFGFGPFNFTVPANTAVYTNRLDVRDSLHVFVDVTAGLDMANRRAFWIFESIDPATGLAATVAANGGFLPINDKTKHNGEGFVTLTLQPLSGAQTGDTVTAIASIVFDTEDTIKTNTWVNTIDAVAPSSKVSILPGSVNPDFPIKWTGKDDSLGSGIRNYTIYYSKNSGPFTLLKENTDSTAMNFSGGTTGSTYSFYSTATDNTGNKEAPKNTGEAITTIQSQQNTCAGTDITFTNSSSGSEYAYQWQVDDGSGYSNTTDGPAYSGTNTTTLTLIHPPTSWYGYKFRLIGSNGSNVISGTPQVLKFTNTWIGTVSPAWENPANWSCGVVPDENTDVSVGPEALHQPKVSSQAFCRSIALSTNVVFTVAAGYNLQITGK